MKIALVNAPYLDMYKRSKIWTRSYFPLGLGYIGAVLKKSRYSVVLLDPEAEGKSIPYLAATLRDYQPDIVGISCLTPSFPNA